MQSGEKNSVGPAETYDVHGVSGGNISFRRAGDRVVFLANRAVVTEIFRDGGEKFVGETIGVSGESVAADAFISEQLVGGPCVGKIPLTSRFVRAHHQAAGLLEDGKIFH